MRYSILMTGLRQILLTLVAIAVVAGPSFAAKHRVYLVAGEFQKVMPDGTSITMWGFAEDADSNLKTVGGELPTVPGPMITVPVTATELEINLRNDLNVPVSIIIPGLARKGNPKLKRFTDGQGRRRVRSFDSETKPHKKHKYKWKILKPGTYIYHSGTHPAVQVPMGLYGGVKNDAAPGQAYSGVSYSYDHEVVLFYSEIDPALNAAVDSGGYGTPAYPSMIHYQPRYFLVNGEPYNTSGPSPSMPIPVPPSGITLIRFLNMGLQSHAPTVLGPYMTVIAEDGNPYRHSREQYSVFMAAGKTRDALITIPAAAVGTKYPVFDRMLNLTNAATPEGGLLTHLQVATPPPSVIDVVTITKAEYYSKSATFTVKAKSDQPDAMLEASVDSFSGPMTFKKFEKGLYEWELTIKGFTPVPVGNVTVVSVFGGSASSAVKVTKWSPPARRLIQIIVEQIRRFVQYFSRR